MSLYYEVFPADDGAEPQLPPLLTAVKVPSGQNVMAKALASGATAEVGTVFYGEDTDVTDIALVLGPEVPLRKAGQMLYAMMIGVGDAIGALAPPEVIVAYQLPGYVLLNRGRAGASVGRVRQKPLGVLPAPEQTSAKDRRAASAGERNFLAGPAVGRWLL